MRILGGRYALGEPLGSGGMASVYVARDELLARDVAVKVVRPDLSRDPATRERLEREARAAASLSHPNVVAVYDVGEDDATPYIVMELVRGRTLADLLGDGALPVEYALRIADEVLDGLAAAHAQGLVHRDVKPANVLLPDDGGPAKLADFGIAKSVRDAMAGLTATGQVLGTPRYLAPEQVAGEAATPRSDLYATGVVLWELLAGRPPFDGDHAIAVALAHQQQEPPPLAEHRPDAPAHVVAAVERAMAKDPAARFADASEMRRALREAPSPRGRRGRRAAAASAAAVAPTIPVDPDEAASTQVLASRAPDAAPPPAGRRPGLGAAAAVAAVALLALAGIGLALQGDDDGSPAGAPTEVAETDDDGATDADAAEDAPADVAPVADPPPAEADPEPGPAPTTPQELLALLERDPDAAGEKGDDLRQKLGDVLEEKPKDQPKKARELIEESAEWARDGDLDPGIAALTAELLAPLAAAEVDDDDDDDEDDDDGSGQGQGRGGPPADRGGGRGED